MLAGVKRTATGINFVWPGIVILSLTCHTTGQLETEVRLPYNTGLAALEMVLAGGKYLKLKLLEHQPGRSVIL